MKNQTAASILVCGICFLPASHLQGAPAPGNPDRIWRFDFGPEKSPVWTGFTHVTDKQAYTEECGFGLTDLKRIKGDVPRQDNVNRPHQIRDALTHDAIYSDNRSAIEFAVDLPNGAYRVWALRSFRQVVENAIVMIGNHSIEAEGEVRHKETMGVEAFFDSYYHFADEWMSAQILKEGVWQHYHKPCLDQWTTFDVTVRDGQLNLRFRGAKRLHGLVVAAAEHRGRIEQELEQVSRQREAWFYENMKDTTKPDPEDQEPLTPDAGQKARGFVLFHRAALGPVNPHSRPAPEEADPTLKLTATPGEYEPTTLSVWALRDLKQAALKATALSSAPGHVIPAEAVKLSIGHYGYSVNADTYALAIRGYRPNQALDFDADFTRRYLVRIRIPEATPPGVYSGRLLFSAENAPEQAVPIQVEVLPFALERIDDMLFSVNSASDARWMRYPAQLRPELAEKYWWWVEEQFKTLREFNMTTIHSYAAPAVRKQQDGTATVNFDGPAIHNNFARYLDTYRKAGFAAGEILFEGANQILCFPLRYDPTYTRLPAYKTDAFRKIWPATCREIDQYVKRHGKDKGWPTLIFMALGEADNYDDASGSGVDKAIAVFQPLAGAGVKTGYRSISRRDLAVLPYLDYGLIANPLYDNIGETSIKEGRRFQLYNSSFNRLGYGLKVWKVGAKGATHEFTQFRYQQLVHNDFVGGGWSGFKLDYVLYGSEGPRPTPPLVEVSEGIDDYRYLRTLEGFIRKAQAKGLPASELAAKSQRFLDRLRENISGERWGSLPEATHEKLRAKIISEILALQEAM
ncbi:MAG: hypothetical protein JXR37_29815 [Kiritimatiellae bacterium]|nr:hypothetical protein [Kiritimatiellia bacterium]